MAYLHKHRIIHRDLAARNVCLQHHDGDFLVAKLTDFGFSRDVSNLEDGVYRVRVDGEGNINVPLSWVPPEDLEVDKTVRRVAGDMGAARASEATDQWGFGVTLWEMVFGSDSPYLAPGSVEHTDYRGERHTRLAAKNDVLEYVRGGGRLTIPANCPPTLRDLMDECWSQQPASRPPMKDVVARLAVRPSEWAQDGELEAWKAWVGVEAMRFNEDMMEDFGDLGYSELVDSVDMNEDNTFSLQEFFFDDDEPDDEATAELKQGDLNRLFDEIIMLKAFNDSFEKGAYHETMRRSRRRTRWGEGGSATVGCF